MYKRQGIARLAKQDLSILIRGESGTGKELIARALHERGPRASGPFIALNCGAIPDTLIDSELFGHTKGSFTGATSDRAGVFVEADQGTLFLDEIGDMPMAVQGRLLRVLEERTVSPVGSDVEVPVDVRIIAATHRNLEDMVAQGTFRADLYFRLAVVPVSLPALRERSDDIIQIAELCIARVRERIGRNVEGLDESGKAALIAYHWPGNVRELSHLIERAVLLARRSRLGAADLTIPGQKVKFARGTDPFLAVYPPPAATASGSSPAIPRGSVPEMPTTDTLDLRAALEHLERDLIDRALTKSGGNRTEAAALLGLNRTTLVEKLRKYAA